MTDPVSDKAQGDNWERKALEKLASSALQEQTAGATMGHLSSRP